MVILVRFTWVFLLVILSGISASAVGERSEQKRLRCQAILTVNTAFQRQLNFQVSRGNAGAAVQGFDRLPDPSLWRVPGAREIRSGVTGLLVRDFRIANFEHSFAPYFEAWLDRKSHINTEATPWNVSHWIDLSPGHGQQDVAETMGQVIFKFTRIGTNISDRKFWRNRRDADLPRLYEDRLTLSLARKVKQARGTAELITDLASELNLSLAPDQYFVSIYELLSATPEGLYLGTFPERVILLDHQGKRISYRRWILAFRGLEPVDFARMTNEQIIALRKTSDPLYIPRVRLVHLDSSGARRGQIPLRVFQLEEPLK